MTDQNLEIRSISAAQTHSLRQSVLRPYQPIEEMVYEGDNAPQTRHFGAFWGEVLVGVASLYHEPKPNENNRNSWRLRGMAVGETERGRGIGRALLQECLSYVAAQNGVVLWCNAREDAIGFYRSLGFETEGERFEIAGVGPHYVMSRALES